MSKIDRIREVLNLEEWHKKQKSIFRRRVLSIILSISLIAGAIYYWIHYV